MKRILVIGILILLIVSSLGCVEKQEVKNEAEDQMKTLKEELLNIFEDREKLQRSTDLPFTYRGKDRLNLIYPEIDIYVPPERRGWRVYIFSQRPPTDTIHKAINDCEYWGFPETFSYLDHISDIFPSWRLNRLVEKLGRKEKLYFVFCNSDFYRDEEPQEYTIYELGIREIVQRYGVALSGWNTEAYVLYKNHEIEIYPSSDIREIGTEYITYKIDPEDSYLVICTDYSFWKWVEQYKIEENVIQQVSTSLDAIVIEPSKIDQMINSLSKASIHDYKRWLEGFYNRKGRITHFYTYPFSRTQDSWYVATRDVTIYPIGRFNIIVSEGVKIIFPEGNPNYHYIYYMENYETNATWIPYYNDIDLDVER